MQINIFITLLLISAVISFLLAVYVWLRRKLLEASSLVWLLIAIAVWCFAYVVELQFEGVGQRKIFILIRCLSTISSPIFLLYFAFDYSRLFNRFRKYLRWPVWVIPALSIIILATNSLHNLFFTFSYDSLGNVVTDYPAGYGPWFWVQVMYTYFLVGISIAVFVRMLVLSSKHQRGNLWLILLCTLTPLVVNIFYVAGFRLIDQVDPTPLAFALSGILFFLGLYSKNLFQVKPITLKTLFNHLPDGILVTDHNAVVTDLNQLAKNILGLEGKEAIGCKVQTLLPYHFDFLNAKALNKLHLVKHNGLYIEANHVLIAGDDKQIAGYIIILKDVSARHLSGEELKAAKDRLELASESAGIDTWENNSTTGDRIGDYAVYSNLGYSNEEVPKTMEEIFALIHPDDQQLVKQRMQDHFEGKTLVYTCDFRIRDKRGDYQWIANFGRVVERDASGSPVRVIGITQNINDRKQVEEKIRRKNDDLIKANAEKDKFFSIIAHDLKGPFQGFIGLTEFMAGNIGNIDEQEMQDIARSINLSAKNLYELLDNLLNWAMIQRGYKRFNPQKINLSALVAEVEEVMLPQLSAKGITYTNSIDSSITLLADREALKTILRNLLSNAVKFSLHNGSISITSQLADKGFMQILVKDSGIGMPDSIKSNLFKISAKVSRPGTDKEPSTGLGLVLCKELVEKHGGKIWVDSLEGEGSTFRFTIPFSGNAYED